MLPAHNKADLPSAGGFRLNPRHAVETTAGNNQKLLAKTRERRVPRPVERSPRLRYGRVGARPPRRPRLSASIIAHVIGDTWNLGEQYGGHDQQGGEPPPS